MKRRIVAISIAIGSIVALMLIGLVIFAIIRQCNAPLPIENSKEIYENAVSGIAPSQDMVLKISHTNEMTVADSTLIESFKKTVEYDILKSGETRIHLHETNTSGSHSFSIDETFFNDTIFMTVNDAPFTATCNKEEYDKTLIPGIILSPNLYGDISGVDNRSSYIIQFSNPTGPEEWLVDTSATLLEASGTASVSYDGKLENSTYTITYEQNGITFRSTTHVQIEQSDVNIQSPADASLYTPIVSWKAPRMLERACGFLMQAESISSSYKDRIYFQAFGDLWSQNISLHVINDNGLSMDMTTNVSIKNDTKQDQQTTYTKKEQFLNGQYFVSSNGETSAANENIDAETVSNYIQNQLISTIVLPQDIASADITEDADILRIHFTGTDTFGSFLLTNACKILYNDTSFVDDTAENFTVSKLDVYLEIQGFTGLPVASGIDLEGSYKKDGIPYQLLYTAEQSYRIPSATQVETEKSAG